MSHLRAVSLGTSSPTAAADLYAALGARIGGTPRGGETLVLVGGTMLTYRRDAEPTRTVLGFMVPDLAVVGDRLTAAAIDWSCESPGVIGFSADSDGNPCYAVESGQRDGLSLIAATLFVRDVSTSAEWWASAGLPTGRTATLGYHVPAAAGHNGDAAVFLGGDLTLHLAAAGDGPVTVMNLRIHVDDPATLDAAGAGLTALGAPVERRGPTELRTMTPEGIAVTLMMRDGIAPDPN